MVQGLPTNAHSIYIDASVLVDLAEKREPRHLKARRLLGLLKKYRMVGMLTLTTSTWAVAEAHGVMYEKKLKDLGLRKPSHLKHIRNIVPPYSTELRAAEKQINALIQELSQTTRFTLWPAPGIDSSPVWQLSTRLAQEAAIWPTDSLHLAIALYTGCSIFVSDDSDLLNKIQHCESDLIIPYRQTEFNYVPNIPDFRYCGVQKLAYWITGQKRKRVRQPVAHVLHQLGFT